MALLKAQENKIASNDRKKESVQYLFLFCFWKEIRECTRIP